MDLSQQELPLTSYFSKGKKENKPITESSKKRNLGTAHPALRPCKRAKEEVSKDVQSAARNASVKSTGSARGRPTNAPVTHLPTPSASTRKRVSSTRGAQPGSSYLQASSRKTGKAVTAHASAVSDVIDLTRTDTEDSPATPSSHSRPHVRHGQHMPPAQPPEVVLPTPATGLRRAPASGVSESPSAARSRFSRLTIAFRPSSNPSLPRQALAAPKSHVPTADRGGRPCCDCGSRNTLHLVDERDPFSEHVDPDGPVNTNIPHEIQHRMITRQSIYELHASEVSHVPVRPVPSSQSQYLLHIDATPKRKRISTRKVSVPSSQVQEERELDMSRLPPLVPESAVREDVEDESSKCNGSQTSSMRAPPPHSDVRTPRRTRHGCVNRHAYTLGSSPLTSPVTSPNGPSGSFLVTKLALDKGSLKPPHPKGKVSPWRSSAHETRPPHCRKLVREDSVKGAPPVAEDDSETELETFSPNRKAPSSKVPCKLVGGKPPDDVSLVPGEDSVTEPESDTDILHCVAAIGKKRVQQVHVHSVPAVGSRHDVESTLKSQSAKRASSNSTQNLTQEGPSLPDAYALRAFGRTRLPGSTDSIPSVVREFMHMFQGDGSYPQDFPESLRT
ncbi:hypothetical protein F5I97DRAFT_1828899 [Phlebopus sp. FC_14]|nr:hypothetical protein F5I97DRAFT_1828899 [Phlebopus sp. FC_14]